MAGKQNQLHIYFGEDSFSVRLALDTVKQSIGEDVAGVNTSTLEERDITPEQLAAVVRSMPFLASKRLVIINGLLDRFEAKSKPAAPKKTSKAASKTPDYQSFAACFENLPESTVIVLLDGKLSGNSPLFKELSKKAEFRSFPLIKYDKLSDWVRKRVIEKGGKISTAAVDLLARLVGSDLWSMANEVEKLVLFAGGRAIEEEDIKQITSHAQEANVYFMVDAILASQVKTAEELLQRLLQGGSAPVQLLSTLSWQMQRLVRVKELESQGKNNYEIQNRLGIWDFALQKTLQQSKRYSLERLKLVYVKLLDTDLAIKTGRLDGDLALSILIAELCQQDMSAGPAAYTHKQR